MSVKGAALRGAVLFSLSCSRFLVRHIPSISLPRDIGLFNFGCMSILLTCMYVYHECAWGLPWSQEGIGFLGTGVMHDCEPLPGSGNGIWVLCKSNECW